MPEVELFHVYVVGAVDTSGEAIPRLAEAMASHYQLPADDLLGRLSRGRFRVKANVDRQTADQYQKDLQQIGAKVLIELSTPSNRASIPPPVGAPSSTLPPPTIPRTTTPPPLQSGLAAAFSGEHAVGDLSAFDRLDSMSLSSLDGHDAGAVETSGLPASFAPPLAQASPRARSEPMDLATPSTPPAKRGRPTDSPVELFAPPDAEEAEMKVDIAADELEYKARKRTPVAMPVAAPPPEPAPQAPARPTPQPSTTVPPPPSTPVLAPKRATGPVATVSRGGKLGPLSDERVRFAAGVVVAILIGFLPATVIASSLESSAFKSIDRKVDQQQANALDLDDYNALDAYRDKQLDAKKSEKRTATLVGLFVWAVAGAGVAYVWFRRVPWDRLDGAV